MELSEFNIDVIFYYVDEVGCNSVYEKELLEKNNGKLEGIGHVIGQSSNGIKIQWLWYPTNEDWVGEWDYSYYDVETWNDRCKIISESDRLALLLKKNFS